MLRRFRYLPTKDRLPDRTRKRSALLALLLLGALPSAGCCLPQMVEATCAPYEAIKQTSMLKFRAARQGRRVWKECHEQRYANHACSNDVKKGFVNAYVEAAIGMRGCPPPVPNRGTFSVDCVMHRYPAAIPWYEGYNIGFASAVAQGVDKWRFAPSNPDLHITQCACPSELTHGSAGVVGQPLGVMHEEVIHDDAELIETPPVEPVPDESLGPVGEEMLPAAAPEASVPVEPVPVTPAPVETVPVEPVPVSPTPAASPETLETVGVEQVEVQEIAVPEQPVEPAPPAPKADAEETEGPETVPTTDLPLDLPEQIPSPSDPVLRETPESVQADEFDSVHLLPTSWTLRRPAGE